MARTAVYIHATVGTGNTLEIPLPPELKAGDQVDVVIMTPDRSPLTEDNARRRSMNEIMNALPPGAGIFSSATDVDQYIRQERDSWDR